MRLPPTSATTPNASAAAASASASGSILSRARKTSARVAAITISTAMSSTTTACCTGHYLAHNDSDTKVAITPVSSTSSATTKGDATWIVRAGLANSSCLSFESFASFESADLDCDEAICCFSKVFICAI